MLTTVATVLAVLIGVGIIGVGVRLLCAPAEAATGFGIPDTPTADPALRSWLAVKAVRDVVSGLLLLVIILVGTPHVLGWFLLVATGIPVGDALIVLGCNGSRAVGFGVHGVTAAIMLFVSLCLLMA